MRLREDSAWLYKHGWRGGAARPSRERAGSLQLPGAVVVKFLAGDPLRGVRFGGGGRSDAARELRAGTRLRRDPRRPLRRRTCERRAGALGEGPDARCCCRPAGAASALRAAAPAPVLSDAVEAELPWSRPPPAAPVLASAPPPAAPRLPLTRGMPAGLSEPAGAAPPAVVSAPGTVALAPAAAPPVRVESAAPAPGAVTKAPGGVCAESGATQPLRSPVGTLLTKVAPVSALPKLGGGPRLPAPQIVTVKAPNTATIQLPANLQLPPGTWITTSRSSVGPACGDHGDAAPTIAPSCS